MGRERKQNELTSACIGFYYCLRRAQDGEVLCCRRPVLVPVLMPVLVAALVAVLVSILINTCSAVCVCEPVCSIRPIRSVRPLQSICPIQSIRSIQPIRPIHMSNAIALVGRTVGQGAIVLGFAYNSWLDIIWIHNIDVVDDAVSNRAPKAGRRDAGASQLPFRPRDNLSHDLSFSLGEVDPRVQLGYANAWWDWKPQYIS